MKITVLTLFPEMLFGFFESSIMKRAVKDGYVDYSFLNFRQFALPPHYKADDEPFGGGAGMVLKPEPLFKALNSINAKGKRVILPTPSGVKFTQKRAAELSKEKELIFICGHYEGIDQRVIDEFVSDEISIGDYVISSGEIASLVLIDAIYRLIPGVISQESLEEESFSKGLLEYPQYTRPEKYCEKIVPSVLLCGNHKKIKEWRNMMALEKTKKNRPDLLAKN